MPGLVESHSHLTFPSAVGHIDPSFNPPLDVSFFRHMPTPDEHLEIARRNAKILLDHGFTSAYSAGSLTPVPTEVRLREEIAAGATPGPRLRASFERDNNPVQMGPDGPKPKQTGPAAVREFIAEQAAIGYDAVKLPSATGSALFPAVGIMWANVYEGAEYGIDTAMAEKMGSVKALRAMTELYPELRKRGLRVLPGGDYGFPNNPIGRTARDLELFVRLFGYSSAEALRATTQYGGQVMDLPVGLLTPGYFADVLVVRGEPAQVVSVLQDTDNLLAIMQNGAFHKLAEQLTAA
jgi:imidazolonepropionase-like amidohydrolase